MPSPSNSPGGSEIPCMTMSEIGVSFGLASLFGDGTWTATFARPSRSIARRRLAGTAERPVAGFGIGRFTVLQPILPYGRVARCQARRGATTGSKHPRKPATTARRRMIDFKTAFRRVGLALRFIAPLTAMLALLALALVPLVDSLTLRWWVADLETRSRLVANTMQEQLVDLVRDGNGARIRQLFRRAVEDERLYAVAYCNDEGQVVYKTTTYPLDLGCREIKGTGPDAHVLRSFPPGPLHVTWFPIPSSGPQAGTLVLVHDMSFVDRRSADTRRYIIGFFILLGVVVSFITVLVAHLSWRGWVAGMRALLRGEGIFQPFRETNNPDLQPLVGEVRALLREVDMSRRNLERGAIWDPEMLRSVLRNELAGDEIVLVSNREPYIHMRHGNEVAIRRPASGLVTAMEPIMRACSG